MIEQIIAFIVDNGGNVSIGAGGLTVAGLLAISLKTPKGRYQFGLMIATILSYVLRQNIGVDETKPMSNALTDILAGAYDQSVGVINPEYPKNPER